MKNFLLVEHDGNLDEFIFVSAIERGLNLFLITANPEKWIYKHISEENVIKVDTEDVDAVINSVKTFLHKRQIVFSGIGTFFERFVLQTAKLCEELNLIGVSVDAANSSSCNKANMRTICQLKKIPQPHFEIIHKNEKNKIKRFIEKYTLGVIKPISGAGSIGVHKIDLNTNIDNLMKEINSELDNDHNKYVKVDNDIFLIEEYVPGVLFSIDGVIQDNQIFFIGETEFFLGKEPYFTQEGGITPTSLEYSEIQNAKEIVRKIIKALKINNCGFHCEMRMTSKGPVLIEIACRTPGGPLLINYKRAYGIDGINIIFDIWLGKKVSCEKTHNTYILHKDVFAYREGVIEKIDILMDLEKQSDVVDLIFFSKKGDTAVNGVFYATTLYYYSISGNSLEEIFHSSKEFEKKIKVYIQ